jgi:cytidylate kinase
MRRLKVVVRMIDQAGLILQVGEREMDCGTQVGFDGANKAKVKIWLEANAGKRARRLSLVTSRQAHTTIEVNVDV